MVREGSLVFDILDGTHAVHDGLDAIDTLTDVSGLLNAVSITLRKLGRVDDDATMILFADALDSARNHTAEVIEWMHAEYEGENLKSVCPIIADDGLVDVQ